MESDFGICSYIHESDQKVPCVLKQMYSDFIVQEVAGDKSVVRFLSRDEVNTAESKENAVEVDVKVEAPDVITPEMVATMESMTQKGAKMSIPIKDVPKEKRRDIHEFVRNRFKGTLVTENKGDNIEVAHTTDTALSRKRKRWDAHNPDNCHFTMAKENKDTAYALGIIARLLNVPVNNLRTQGIKDRRAVTAQRVSVRRIEKERIMSLNSRLREILVYDCEYRADELITGGHWGNRFNIVLREVPTDTKEVLIERLKGFEEKGFVNYYGTQRFGSCGTGTADVGRLILQRKWEEAVRLILSIDMEFAGTVGDAVRHFNETNDASEALKKLKGAQAFATIEASILKCLKYGGTWQNCITDAIPRHVRSLYVHAYQSLLWNKAATKRIEEGLAIRDGDIDRNGKSLNAECGSTIYDIFIPLPGVNVNFTESSAYKLYQEWMTEDGLDDTSLSSLKDRFALGETGRLLLIKPEDVTYEFINYTGPRTMLQNGLYTKREDDKMTGGDLMALKVCFNLPSGAYATIALRELTGFDLGKKSMKAHISTSNVKTEGDGDVPEENAADDVEDSENVENCGDIKAEVE